MSSKKWNKIIEHLSKDEKLRVALRSAQLPEIGEREDVYGSLLRAIVGQQLSGKAAATIFARFLNLFTGEDPQPHLVLQKSIEELRAVGLSRQKAGYVQNVAAYFSQPEVLKTDWKALSNEEIMKRLTAIKGVGEWTAQMLLMFTLARPDVLPEKDLGIQQAMTMLYGLQSKGRELQCEMRTIAESWRPYRSYACRLLWKYKDGN